MAKQRRRLSGAQVPKRFFHARNVCKRQAVGEHGDGGDVVLPEPTVEVGSGGRPLMK